MLTVVELCCMHYLSVAKILCIFLWSGAMLCSRTIVNWTLDSWFEHTWFFPTLLWSCTFSTASDPWVFNHLYSCFLGFASLKLRWVPINSTRTTRVCDWFIATRPTEMGGIGSPLWVRDANRLSQLKALERCWPEHPYITPRRFSFFRTAHFDVIKSPRRPNFWRLCFVHAEVRPRRHHIDVPRRPRPGAPPNSAGLSMFLHQSSWVIVSVWLEHGDPHWVIYLIPAMDWKSGPRYIMIGSSRPLSWLIFQPKCQFGMDLACLEECVTECRGTPANTRALLPHWFWKFDLSTRINFTSSA